jgi:cystathionine beta-lyase
VFSVVLKSGVSKEQVYSFVNSLELFKIGYSWGGVTSLAVAYDFTHYKERPQYQHRVVRLNIGLEEVADLISDLARSFDLMQNVGR